MKGPHAFVSARPGLKATAWPGVRWVAAGVPAAAPAALRLASGASSVNVKLDDAVAARVWRTMPAWRSVSGAALRDKPKTDIS